MSQAPIMPFFTDAYLADCHHISTEAHGALLLILLHTWRSGGKPLPDDDTVMARIVKAPSTTRWRKLKVELMPFFDITGGFWRQKRLEQTWNKVIHRIEQNRLNGARGGTLQSKTKKNLKLIDSLCATAHNLQSPSMNLLSSNHKPEPNISKNSSTNHKEIDIMLSPVPRVAVALEALTPVLSDSNYFLPRGGYRISPNLLPQIKQAVEEVELQLEPVSKERLGQLLTRLMMHFPATPRDKIGSIYRDYTEMLKGFPEDLLCAAYHHVLKQHKYNSLPKIADFISFMQPEMAHRNACRSKLNLLQQKSESEVCA